MAADAPAAATDAPAAATDAPATGADAPSAGADAPAADAPATAADAPAADDDAPAKPEATPEEKEAQGKRVYVGNLDWHVSWQELKDHMREAGDVAFADIFTERDGRSKGCAIVEFRTEEGAKKAVAELNDTTLGSRMIFVREDHEARKGKGGGKGGYKGGKASGWQGYGGKGGKGYGGKGKGKEWGETPAHMRPLRVGPSDKGHLIYVGNLPFRTSWQDLKDVFKEHGEVIRVDIATDEMQRSKGYATVLYRTSEEAQTAIDNCNEEDFQGRKLMVRHDNYL